MTSQSASRQGEFVIEPVGAFSLRESVEFGFGQRHSTRFEGVMRLAFCLDGYRQQVGVEVRQDRSVNGGDADGDVRGAVFAGEAVDLDVVRAQVARVLSLDHDARPLVDIGKRDPVIGRLLGVARGLRPPLFYSPYEAAAWSVLSARRPAVQMAQVRDLLALEHGAVFELAGQPVAAFPLPERLLQVQDVPGLSPDKIDRLHGVARAALEGTLDTARLLAMGPDAATLEVQRLKGIGPFYASLIAIRATGFADVLPESEPKLLELVTRLYDLPGPCDARTLAAIGEQWRPLRTWCAVLIRAAASRLEATEGGSLQRGKSASP